MATPVTEPPTTPDGRYIVVRGRLWRKSDPSLAPEARQTLVDELMAARRAVQSARRSDDQAALQRARARVDAAKIGLGERGPVWWADGAPDLNRRMARNTSYADWYAAIASKAGEPEGRSMQAPDRHPPRLPDPGPAPRC